MNNTFSIHVPNFFGISLASAVQVVVRLQGVKRILMVEDNAGLCEHADNRVPISLQSLRSSLIMTLSKPDDLTYYGYRILSDVSEVAGAGIWMGKAAVVQPADASGIERVSPIFAAAAFNSEKAAYDYIILEAKKWIDKEILRQL